MIQNRSFMHLAISSVHRLVWYLAFVGMAASMATAETIRFSGSVHLSPNGVPDAVDRPVRYKTWHDMCQVYPCETFPDNYVTVVFGERTYYFPMRKLSGTDWESQSLGQESIEILRYNLAQTSNAPKRAFSYLGFSIKCCSEIFAWFGIDNEFIRDSRGVNRLSLHPYSPNHRYPLSSDSLRFVVFGKAAEGIDEIDPPHIPATLRHEASESFWQLEDSFSNKMFVSKNPVLAESYVVMRCRGDDLYLCDIQTLRYADEAKVAPLYAQLRLLAPVDSKGSYTLESVASILADIDEMLQLARVHPNRP